MGKKDFEFKNILVQRSFGSKERLGKQKRATKSLVKENLSFKFK